MRRSGVKARKPETLEGKAATLAGVFGVWCPVCCAEAGFPCVNRDGHTSRSHLQRRRLASVRQKEYNTPND